MRIEFYLLFIKIRLHLQRTFINFNIRRKIQVSDSAHFDIFPRQIMQLLMISSLTLLMTVNWFFCTKILKEHKLVVSDAFRKHFIYDGYWFKRNNMCLKSIQSPILCPFSFFSNGHVSFENTILSQRNALKSNHFIKASFTLFKLRKPLSECY